jgi:hypothetical protein
MSNHNIPFFTSPAEWTKNFSEALIKELKEKGVPLNIIYKFNGNTGEGMRLIHTCAEKMARLAESEILTPLVDKSTFIIDSTDGKDLLSDSKDLFGYIDPCFKEWDADEKGQATLETPAWMYQMTVEETTIFEMFNSLSYNMETLLFSQSQIRNFVKKYRDRFFRTDTDILIWPAIFLFKSNNELFNVIVDIRSDNNLGIYLHRFGYPSPYQSKYHYRVVIPEQT